MHWRYITTYVFVPWLKYRFVSVPWRQIQCISPCFFSPVLFFSLFPCMNSVYPSSCRVVRSVSSRSPGSQFYGPLPVTCLSVLFSGRSPMQLTLCHTLAPAISSSSFAAVLRICSCAIASVLSTSPPRWQFYVQFMPECHSFISILLFPGAGSMHLTCPRAVEPVLYVPLAWCQVVSAQDAGAPVSGGGNGGVHNSGGNIYCSSINSPDSIGRRRKKRTSIESTVRMALERAFSQGQRPKPVSLDTKSAEQ
jgi:hypothetical protein